MCGVVPVIATTERLSAGGMTMSFQRDQRAQRRPRNERMNRMTTIKPTR
jgi:hypothetical protein